MIMQGYGAAIVALGFCLGGCGARTGNETAGGDNAAAANAAAPGEPCPFATRNIRAAVATSAGRQGGQQVMINVEFRPDREGRVPAINQRLTPPPELILDIDRDPHMPPSQDHEWRQVGMGGYPATADYDHVVVRCLGTRIARVPIRRQGAAL
jgi:hypothetical protein